MELALCAPSIGGPCLPLSGRSELCRKRRGRRIEPRPQCGRMQGSYSIPFLAPALVFMVAAFLTPLIFVAYTSVVGDHGFSLGYYGQILTQPLYRRVAENSLEI